MLSPSEIQSLFQGLDLTRVPANDDIPVAHQYTLPLEIAPAERAGLVAWQSTFGEQWRQSWPEQLRRRFALKCKALRADRFCDCIPHQSDQCCVHVRASNAAEMFWMAIDQHFVSAHLDCLLGASHSEPAADARRMWGALEQQLTAGLIRGAADVVFPDLIPAGECQSHISYLSSSSEWVDRSAQFLSTEVIHFTFEIGTDAFRGEVSLIVPRSACRRLLAISKSAPRSHGLENGDATNANELTAMRVTLPPLELSLAACGQLQVGDVLVSQHPIDAPCHVSLADGVEFQATLGSHQGHKAIRLSDAAVENSEN